jgi:hypothetical protein
VEKPREARTETVYVYLYFQSYHEELIGSVNPHIMEFKANMMIETREFEVNLQVSPMISSVNIDGTFTVYGEWSYKYYSSGGSISPVSGQVILNPFYRLWGKVLNEKELFEVPIGSWRTADFEVFNQGNDKVTITLHEVHEDQTLDCDIQESTVTLNEGESKIVPIRLRKESGSVEPEVYEQKIRLEARVEGGEVVNYETSIFLGTIYTPKSFISSVWFKVSIAGVVILAILITILVIWRRRRKRVKIQIMEVQEI